MHPSQRSLARLVRHFTPSFLPALALTAVLAACGGDGGGGTDPEGFGTVQGVVRALDGVTPIPGAIVKLKGGSATAPRDTTDAAGAYTLTDVPAGQQTLVAERGVFRAELQVNVRPNETVTAPTAKIKSTGKLAFVPGAYDNIEAIVRDQLGNPMDELTETDLGNATVLSRYKMIFLNCGLNSSDITSDEQTLERLRTWVSNGGILYISDQAIDVVQALFPQDIIGTPLSGEAQDVAATITSQALRDFTSKTSAQIRYDLIYWQTPDAVSARTEVLLRGTFTDVDGTTVHSNKPLAIVIPHGQGKVVFTSFHNEAGVTADQIAVLRYFVYLQ